MVNKLKFFKVEFFNTEKTQKNELEKKIYCQTFTLYSYIISKYANNKYSHVIHI